MAKAERTLPATMGASQRSFCSGVATFSSTIMLPSSGAAELRPPARRSSGSWLRSRPPCRPCRGRRRGLGLQLEAPQAFRLRQGAQALQLRHGDVPVAVIGGAVPLHRQDVSLDEGRDAGARILDARRNGEIHDLPVSQPAARRERERRRCSASAFSSSALTWPENLVLARAMCARRGSPRGPHRPRRPRPGSRRARSRCRRTGAARPAAPRP